MPREWMTAARLRLRALIYRRRLDRDLEDELAFHLAMKAERLGSEPAARRRFGNVAGIRETCRDLWSLGWIEILWQDVRYSLRLLRRSPVFTTVAVASLALGIGANTLIFSLINAVLLKSLPVRDPHELRVVLWSAAKASFENYSGAGTRPQPSGLKTGGSFSYPVYREFRDRAAGFSDLFAFAGVHEASVVHRGEAFTATGLAVSGNFCRGLGVRALLGRTLTPEDDRPDAPPVAVVTHSYWERHTAFDPGILGQNVMLNGSGYTIVGVLPPKVYGPVPGADTGFLVPLSAQPRILPRFPLESPKHWWLQIMGRLQPGIDERQARASLEVLFLPLLKASAQRIERAGIVLEDGRTGAVTGYQIQYRRPLLFLLGAVGLVLLIACANLASLLLFRLNAGTAGYKGRQPVDFYERVRQRAAVVTLSDSAGPRPGCLGQRGRSAGCGGERSVRPRDLPGRGSARQDLPRRQERYPDRGGLPRRQVRPTHPSRRTHDVPPSACMGSWPIPSRAAAPTLATGWLWAPIAATCSA
jgi:hypothetical protein